MKYWFCTEMVTGENYLVRAGDLLEAYRVADEIGADFSCGCEQEPDVYVNPKPLTENEVKIMGLNAY